MTSDWSYRPALDGLRAFAVYSVLLYHAQVRFASGGFIGVDLFFVLSGFLVTNVVLSENDKGTFRPFKFWARRFKRLLPAIVVVISITAIVFAALTMPAERQQALSEARSAALYFANWHFLHAGNDYFASEDLARPFTHFWSLSVEEQFYFVFPIVIVVSSWCARLLRRRLDVILGVLVTALAIASLVSQIMSAHSNELRAYYATDARMYQILAGSLTAIAFRSPRIRTLLHKCSDAMIAVITVVALAVFFLFVSNTFTISASRRGLIAVAASLVVIASLELAPRSPVRKLLSTAPLVHLGRLSYGTYLWHWPVIVVIDRIVTVGPVTRAIATTLISTAFAEFSLRAVETPIRTSALLGKFSRSTVALGLSTSALLGTVIVPTILNNKGHSVLISTAADIGNVPTTPGIDYTLPPNLDWKAAKEDIPALPDCVTTTPQDCVVVQGTPGNLRIHLVGDSHARTLIPALTSIAHTHGWTFSVTAIGGCPWQINLRYKNDAERTTRCDQHQPAWYNTVIPKLNPDVVILFNRAFDDPHFRRAMYVKGKTTKPDTQFEIIRSTSESTIDSLIKDGRRVISIEQLPLARRDVTNCLSGAKTQQECTFTASPGPMPTEVALRYLDLTHDNFASIDFDSTVCPQLPLCLPVIDGIIVRRDAHHLTGTFSKHIAPHLDAAMNATGLMSRH